MRNMTHEHSIGAVGVIGAGRMGQPIIGHLVRKGFVAIVHDVDAGTRGRIEGLAHARGNDGVAPPPVAPAATLYSAATRPPNAGGASPSWRLATSRSASIGIEQDQPQLVLVTCYPFDSPMPGTVWRYVVITEGEPG